MRDRDEEFGKMCVDAEAFGGIGVSSSDPESESMSSSVALMGVGSGKSSDTKDSWKPMTFRRAQRLADKRHENHD